MAAKVWQYPIDRAFERQTPVLATHFNEASRSFSYNRPHFYPDKPYGDTRPTLIQAWDRFVPMTPVTAADILLRDMPQGTWASMDLDEKGQGDIRLHHPDIEKAQIRFNLRARNAEHNDMKIRPGHQSQGLGRRIARNQIEFLLLCGIEKITATTMQTGGYSWARFGYGVNRSSVSGISNAVHSRFNILKSFMEPRDIRKAERMLSVKTAKDVWRLADEPAVPALCAAYREAVYDLDTRDRMKILHDLFTQNGVKIAARPSLQALTPGQIFLTETVWDGAISARNKQQLKRISEYTGGFRYIHSL